MAADRMSEIFRRYRTERENIEISLDDMRNDLREYMHSIVLYGAGSAGIAFLNYFRDVGIEPVCFSDGDSEKWGNTCEALEIIPPAEIVNRVGDHALVIVTINTDGKSYCKDFKKELLAGGHQGVHKRLRECGCKNIIDYTYFRRCYSLFQGGRYNLPACTDVYLMTENQDKIGKAYDMMHDDESREVFLKILEFRLITDEVEIPVYPEKGMYFEYDLFPRLKDEVFVDCGACGGSSLKEFLQYNGHRFKKYYGIEPDPINYGRLEQYIAELTEDERGRIHISNTAAYSHTEGEAFYVLGGPGTFQAETGSQTVPTETIDHILDKERATYIKMNIEGSEVPALRGAERTIRECRPRLGIMGYHKTSDFWEVPLLMREYVQDYHISLRSYMKNVAFTYYAF